MSGDIDVVSATCRECATTSHNCVADPHGRPICPECADEMAHTMRERARAARDEKGLVPVAMTVAKLFAATLIAPVAIVATAVRRVIQR